MWSINQSREKKNLKEKKIKKKSETKKVKGKVLDWLMKKKKGGTRRIFGGVGINEIK